MSDGINGAVINTEREAYRAKVKGKLGTWYPVYNGWNFIPDKIRKPKRKKKHGVSYLTKDEIESNRIRRAAKGDSKEHN